MEPTERMSRAWRVAEDSIILSAMNAIQYIQQLKIGKHEELLKSLTEEPCAAASLRDTGYVVKTIRKKDGSSRQLLMPHFRLKKSQRELLRLLNEKIKLPDCATAKVGSSFTINASKHLGARHILNMDIRGFYESVTAEKVRAVVAEYYPEHSKWFNQHSYLMFVNKVALTDDEMFVLSDGSRSTHQPISAITFRHLFLPTGAPTSPFLSNIAALPLDNKITKYLEQYNGTYTRYIDDVTLSFKQELTNFQMNEIRDQVTKFFEEEGWVLHPLKTKWLNPSNNRITVTGVDVRGDQLRITSRYIKDKIKPWINAETANICYLDKYLGKSFEFTKNQVKNGINTFEECIPIYFSRSFVSTLSYIKQVNIDQYNKCIEYIKQRLLAHQDRLYRTEGHTLQTLLIRYCGDNANLPFKYRNGGSIVDALLEIAQDKLDDYKRDYNDLRTPF